MEDGRVVPVQVKEGDYVAYSDFAGQEIKLDGEAHIILRSEDLLGSVSES